MISNYFKLAWRSLIKNKGYAAINIIGLAMGMAITMCIAFWVYDELNYNKYHKNHDTLGQLRVNQSFNGETANSVAISIPMGKALQSKYADKFTATSFCSWTIPHTLAFGEVRINQGGVNAEPALPKMISLRMISGSITDGLKEPTSVMLAASIAKALFADEDPMGKTIRMDNHFDLMVTGVYEDIPANSSLSDMKIMLSWQQYIADQEWIKYAQENWDNHSFQFFTQLAPGISIDAVNKLIRDEEKPHVAAAQKPEYFIHPMNKWHLYGEFRDGKNVGGRITFVWLFSIIGVFVLLLACINFMNLSTARSEKRAREVGIRKTMGSFRRQLIWQFFGESIVVAAIAFVIAVLLVVIAMPAFNEVAGKSIQLPFAEPLLWVSGLAFVLITGLLAGSYPAMYLSSFNPLQVLKGTYKAGHWAAVPRRVLVVLQFTISIALIIGTLFVFRQVQHARNRPVGYNREALVQCFTSRETYTKTDLVKTELMNSGVVEKVAISSNPVTEIWSNMNGFSWEGLSPETKPSFGVVAVDFDFGNTVEWEIVKGRDFNKKMGADSTNIILNEAAVKLVGNEDIINKTIFYEGEPRTVIGVVKNLIMESPYTPIKPTIFFVDPEWANVVNIKLKPGLPVQESLKKIETVFKSLDPNTPFEYRFVDEDYNNKFRSEVRVGKLSAIFTVLAILISCLGLFGLASFTAEQKAKEIGIRKVLGGTLLNIWTLLSREFVVLTIISMTIATPLAYWILNGWLEKFQYKTNLSWKVFALTYFLAMFITLLTVSFQAIKAALANPVKSLRTE